jgi:hypothetical protein
MCKPEQNFSNFHNLGKIRFYCDNGQFYSQSSLTGGATTKIRCSALTECAQPKMYHWLLSQEIINMFHLVRRHTVYFSPRGEMAPPVHKI